MLLIGTHFWVLNNVFVPNLTLFQLSSSVLEYWMIYDSKAITKGTAYSRWLAKAGTTSFYSPYLLPDTVGQGVHSH